MRKGSLRLFHLIYLKYFNVFQKPFNVFQKSKNMLAVMKKVPFMTILRTAVITAILKIFPDLIMIHLIKHYSV